MASWCSRLARQPVTLEVDGSSPFEVAKKEKPSIWMAFLFLAVLKSGLEPFKCNTPVGCCWIPAGRNPLLMLCHRHNSIESVRGFHTVRHPFGWLFFFAVLKSGLEPFKCNTPVGCCGFRLDGIHTLRCATGTTASCPFEDALRLPLASEKAKSCRSFVNVRERQLL